MHGRFGPIRNNFRASRKKHFWNNLMCNKWVTNGRTSHLCTIDLQLSSLRLYGSSLRYDHTVCKIVKNVISCNFTSEWLMRIRILLLLIPKKSLKILTIAKNVQINDIYPCFTVRPHDDVFKVLMIIKRSRYFRLIHPILQVVKRHKKRCTCICLILQNSKCCIGSAVFEF